MPSIDDTLFDLILTFRPLDALDIESYDQFIRSLDSIELVDFALGLERISNRDILNMDNSIETINSLPAVKAFLVGDFIDSGPSLP